VSLRTPGYAKVALYSCLANGTLAAVKYGLGVVSGSLAFKADAVHSFADVISALTIFVGILIADRKTKTFPEGLYKVENLVALLSSLFIFFAAYEIAREAVWGHAAARIENLPTLLIGIVFILAVAYLFSRYELKVGLDAGSPSLVADAKHVVTDILATLVILVGVLGSFFGYRLDRYAALIVAALVGKIGFQILVDSLKVLLDATLDYATLNGIRKVLESHPNVKEVISLGGRSSGRYKFVEIALTMDVKLLRDAHGVTSDLEEEILDRWPEMDRILIHYEPEKRDSVLMASPLSSGVALPFSDKSKLSDHFGSAPCFVLIRKNLPDGSTRVLEILPNPFSELERKRGVKVAELLAEQSVDQVWTRAELEGKGAKYALEALDIEVLPTAACTVEELIREIEQRS
jgi:cation diffusion facilitator family transporter